MLDRLTKLANKIESVEPSAHCLIDGYNCQIIATFDKRPDVEIAILTPAAQAQLKKGPLETEDYSDILFSVKRIANWSIA